MTRLLFFAATATWGFLLGVAALAYAHLRDPSPVRADGGTIATLALALGIAVLGGGVMATAYRNNRHHRS